MTIDRRGLRTWIEIDCKALAHNYKTFRSLIPKKTLLMAVVKSNAYGHDFIGISKELQKLGVDYIGVDSIVEALALRREKISKPILVLGYTLPEMLTEAVKNNIEVTISSFEQLSHISKLKLKNDEVLNIHIKVDTGMHRQGFQLFEMRKVVTAIKKIPKYIQIKGLFTHFASAKNPAFPKDTEKQISEFEMWRKNFSKAGIETISHAGATGGTLLFPKAHYDMVRVGIGMYGQWPSTETEAYCPKKIILKPILTWKTIISEIKKVRKGERVGYDFTEILSRNSTIGIIPVGYWHGYPRSLSSVGRMIVSGQYVKVLGRVSMDMIVVDLTDLHKPKVGDEVIIMGRDRAKTISASDIAILANVSHYETLTNLNPLIKRFFV